MTEYLETTVDKFIFKVATDRFYNGEGVWAKAEGGLVRIGLSDFLQQRSGDVAFAEVKPAGTQLAVGDEVAVIETIKVNISLASPVSGKIVEVNPAMETAPEAINQDPYGAGWLAVIEADRLGSRPRTPARSPGVFRQDEGGSRRGGQEIMTDEPINKRHPRVVIVPCSGIGKTYGTVSREAAYDVTEDLRPDDTQLVALSLLVLGRRSSALRWLAANPAVTIDGCKLACATKMVKESGGTVAQDFAVLDVYRRYKQFKPQGIAELNEGGQQLAHALAEEIAAVVDEHAGEDEGGQNG